MSWLDSRISYIRRVTAPGAVLDTPTVREALDKIRSGAFAQVVNHVRAVEDPIERQVEKKRLLPFYTFSGRFPYRANDRLERHSGLVVLDFDHALDLHALRAGVESSPHVGAAFASTSGDGLKALVPVICIDGETGEERLPENDAEHKQAFATVASLFSGANLDHGCSDVSRACYVSIDPTLYFDPDAAPVRVRLRPPQRSERRSYDGPDPEGVEMERIRSALAWLPDRLDYKRDDGLPDWLRMVTAVLDGCHGDEALAESLLRERWPEEEAGEYARMFEHPLDRVTVASLYHAAKGYGWDASRRRSPHSPTNVSTSAEGANDEKWPEPEPIRHTSERYPVAALDPDWLPTRVRAWVADVAHRMQIALDFPAVAAMVMLSACIGRRVAIRPKCRDAWTVICNLWGAIVGRPGLMKSPVLKQITAPLVRLHVEAQKVHEAALAEHEAALLTYEAQKAAVKEQMKQRLKEDPRADVSELVASLKPPELPRREELVVNDATPEALIETARDSPLGFLQLRDELFGLFARLSSPKAGEERTLYLSSWNGDESIAQKRIGRGYVHAEAVCQAILGGVQPGKLTGLLVGAMRGGMDDDGMVQRLQLLVQPDLPPEFYLIDEWPDKEAKQEAYDLVRALVDLDAVALGAEQDVGFDGEPEGVPYLRFGPEAQEAFNAWLTELERRLRSGSLHPALESHFAKYRSLVPSLALILHLADGEAGPVSRGALGRALKWADYLEGHAFRVYGMAQAPGEAGARQLARKVLAGELGERFTVRTVYRKGWSGLASAEEAQAAADVLVDHGWLRETQATSGRRTYTEYAVNPRLANSDRQTLLPQRAPALTHRRMVTDEPSSLHTSASVSASAPPSVPSSCGDGVMGEPALTDPNTAPL